MASHHGSGFIASFHYRRQTESNNDATRLPDPAPSVPRPIPQRGCAAREQASTGVPPCCHTNRTRIRSTPWFAACQTDAWMIFGGTGWWSGVDYSCACSPQCMHLHCRAVDNTLDASASHSEFMREGMQCRSNNKLPKTCF